MRTRGQLLTDASPNSAESTLSKDQKGLAYLIKAQDSLNTKIERNELCPCGSGKKYKKCCRA